MDALVEAVNEGIVVSLISKWNSLVWLLLAKHLIGQLEWVVWLIGLLSLEDNFVVRARVYQLKRLLRSLLLTRSASKVHLTNDVIVSNRREGASADLCRLVHPLLLHFS